MADKNMAEQFPEGQVEPRLGKVNLESCKGKIALVPIPNLAMQAIDVDFSIEVQPTAMPWLVKNRSDDLDSTGKPK